MPPDIAAAVRKILHRPSDSHKYDFGHVLVIGGSPGMVGAPLLSGLAALRTGAGLVTIASNSEVIDKLEARIAEIMTLRLPSQPKAALLDFIASRKVSVTVIGPGLPPDRSRLILKSLLGGDLTLVLDGGALAALPGQLPKSDQAIVLTPHLGEFKRLVAKSLPTAKNELLQLARSFTNDYPVTLVLKGQPTYVIHQSDVCQNTSGGPALATAGTGDVLAGMIGGLIGQGLRPFEASQAAVYLHGLAGDLATKSYTEAGVIASDVIEFIPAALQTIG